MDTTDHETTSQWTDKRLLFAILSEKYSIDELHRLCFDLNIDPENIRRQTKSRFAEELIQYCDRHSRYTELDRFVLSNWWVDWMDVITLKELPIPDIDAFPLYMKLESLKVKLLSDVLDYRYSIEELQELIKKLGVNHDNFNQRFKRGLSAQLIDFCATHNLYPNLVFLVLRSWWEDWSKTNYIPIPQTFEVQSNDKRFYLVDGKEERTTKGCTLKITLYVVIVFGIGLTLLYSQLFDTSEIGSPSVIITKIAGALFTPSPTATPTATATLTATPTATPTPTLMANMTLTPAHQSTMTALQKTREAEITGSLTPVPNSTLETVAPTPIQGVGLQTLPEGIRDQVSSVRVSGGCALLYGSATSADEFLPVCEDIPLLPPVWANHTKQVDADCESGTGVIQVTVYTDGDFKGEAFALSFCR